MTKSQIVPGCYVGGSWGQYATARMIQIASESWGYDDHGVTLLAQRKLDSMMPSRNIELTEDEEQELSDHDDDVVNWLNENVASEGHSFGWYDGEFFYQSQEWWDEDA